ncbi:hypothetical protein [Ralstonia solanacearum]|uniref:hypothetical protein n=1 Tax=Ralstonia solanacearum TaxID=305 RepID=UPI000ADBCEB0
MQSKLQKIQFSGHAILSGNVKKSRRRDDRRSTYKKGRRISTAQNDPMAPCRRDNDWFADFLWRWVGGG